MAKSEKKKVSRVFGANSRFALIQCLSLVSKGKKNVCVSDLFPSLWYSLFAAEHRVHIFSIPSVTTPEIIFNVSLKWYSLFVYKFIFIFVFYYLFWFCIYKDVLFSYIYFYMYRFIFHFGFNSLARALVRWFLNHFVSLSFRSLDSHKHIYVYVHIFVFFFILFCFKYNYLKIIALSCFYTKEKIIMLYPKCSLVHFIYVFCFYYNFWFGLFCWL